MAAEVRFFPSASRERSMSEIDVDTLLPNARVKEAVLDGDITQLTRGASNRYAEEGDTFTLKGETFEVTSVERRTLGEFTDEDARREGSESLEAYKERMERVHRGNFEWDDSDEVLTYRFERQD
jgi:hypothetical protein